jgi:hypothetical protein
LKKVILFSSSIGVFLTVLFIIISIVGIINNKFGKEGLFENDYMVITGKVENYELRKINGQCFESFSINNVYFSYSDFVNDIGYNLTACNGGLITKDGLELVITYLAIEDENKIIKIQSYQQQILLP